MPAPTVPQDAVVVTTTDSMASELAAAVTVTAAELALYTCHNSIMYSATVVNTVTVAAAELVIYTCHKFIQYSAKVVNAAAAAVIAPLARWTCSSYNL